MVNLVPAQARFAASLKLEPVGSLGFGGPSMVDVLSTLSGGQSVGLAACVATLVILVYGWWNLGT